LLWLRSSHQIYALAPSAYADLQFPIRKPNGNVSRISHLTSRMDPFGPLSVICWSICKYKITWIWI
jgi:hypothetical protein